MRIVLKWVAFFLGYIFHHNHDSKIIYYHDVGKRYTAMGTEIGLLFQHISLAQKLGYSFVPIITAPKKQLMVCFDDGWAGIYDHRFDLVNRGVFPTVFIAVALIGTEGYLSKAQILELKDIGFRFQSHTWSHVDLTMCNEVQLEHELKDSKEWFEHTFSTSFDEICFPMGRFSQGIITRCMEYGYSILYTSLGGSIELGESLLNRNCVQAASPIVFHWMLNGTSVILRKHLEKQHIA